ncbi:hypothetical protein THAR02_00744 [Trichoderma harzianum]|uniref:Uncharacterized protein n=1 Tax=Trichoderma harzianum TaxID=5544 RepID=A0A0F9Y589_TRIHA|nr:hypothetical protein THAR02_00744 [Trichoderma harzianum]
MARRHTVCPNPDRAPPLTRYHGPTTRHYAVYLNPERAHDNLMSTGQDRLVPSFNNLPTELLIKIWESVIGTHGVLRVTTRNHGRVVVTPALARSTAAGRAAVSVSRAHRALILENILPNEITIWGYNSFRGCPYSPTCVVRYKAARDMIYVGWPSSDMSNWTRLQSLKTAHPHMYEKAVARTSWMHNVQKLALDWGPGYIHETQDAISQWFSGLKELYTVCPTNEMLDTEDDEDAEEDNPQDAPSQEVPQDVPQETTLESLMEMESTAPTPEHEHDNDAFLHTGTYKGVCEDDTYISGRAALEWLGPRRSKMAIIHAVERYNEESEKRRQAGLDADMRLSILLHVIDDEEDRWWGLRRRLV